MSEESFQDFCLQNKHIISYYTDKQSKFSFIFTLQTLSRIFDNPNSNQISDNMTNILRLAIFLFKGNIEKSQEFLSKIKVIKIEYHNELLKCALYSKKIELCRLIIDYIRDDDVRNLVMYAVSVIKSKNFEAFVYFIDNTLFKEQLTYPPNFYMLAAESSPEIFKYIVTSKPYTHSDINSISENFIINIDFEIVRFLLTLFETDTFELENSFVNTEDQIREEFIPDIENFYEELNDDKNVKIYKNAVLNLRSNFKIVSKYNDRYRISQDNQINKELRNRLFYIDDEIKSLKKTLKDLYHVENLENPFASSAGRVLIQKTQSEIAVLKKEADVIKNDFLLTV